MTASVPATPRAGFTLLEVVIALAILTLGISSALALFTAATAAHKRAIDRIHSIAIAEHAIADVESALAFGADPVELMKEPPFEEIERNWPGYAVQLEFLGVEGETSEDEILIQITVHWRTQGRDRRQVFRQLVAREMAWD